MVPQGWLSPSLILPRLSASGVPQLIAPVSARIGAAANIPAERVERAFEEAMQGEGFSVGRGVAIPHTELADLEQTFVCLVTLTEPLPARTLDGRAPDLFLFILSRPDPRAHLLLLAHLARLTQSRTLLEGLRRAKDADEILALVSAAELRHQFTQGPAPLAVPARPVAATEVLVLISASGEKLLDALLIELVDQGFADACVLEAQSLREAATREVPLFAGFRDLFGDPGGRRMLILEATSDRVERILGAVQRVCDEQRSTDARVSVLPVQTRWHPPADPEPGEAR
jgi:mannitol/fructose-specific phosphotransferase system IIA component (Ntr-type)